MAKRDYITVTDTASLSKLISHINSNNILSFDTETTGLIPRVHKVIGFSVSGEEGAGYYIPHLTWDKNKEELVEVFSYEKMVEILNMLHGKELLMWNGSFDVRMTKHYFGVDLVDSLFADIMLMKHTVEEEGRFDLKGTAIQYQKELGFDVEDEANKEQLELKANVKANGGSITKTNYEMYKADLEVMGPYAAADADLTLRLANIFRDKLEKDSLEEFFYDDEVMPLYRNVTIPMEDAGVKLNLELIKKSKEKIEKSIARIHGEVLEALNESDDVYYWLVHTATSKFPPKKTGKFGQRLVDLYGLSLPKTASGTYSLTKKNLEKLPDGSVKDFLLTGDEGYLDLKDINEISIELWKEFNGDFVNISSKKQMGEIVFDYLNYKALSTTDKGAKQFNDDMITYLAEKEDLEWAKKLSNYNKLVKIKSAYMDRFLDNHINGMYYFYYKQHGTISGRYSSDAQQLPRPKEEGELDPEVLYFNNLIRAFFIAGEGRKFIDADYESLEPHVFSHVSGDEGLRNIFRKGHDFYSTIAIATEKLSGVSADKKAENYLGKVNKPLRQNAKAYSLGVPYGLSPYALAKTLEIEQEEAQELYDGYLDGFPKLKLWMSESKTKAQKFGYVTTQTGRMRHLNKVKELHKIHGEKLLDFKYRNSLQKKLTLRHGKEEAKSIVKNSYLDYKNGLNNARNFQIQGLSASIVNKAMIAISQDFKRLNVDGYVCATVHDQIIVNVCEKDLDKALEIVENRMTTVVKLSVDLKAPPEVADNWKEGH